MASFIQLSCGPRRGIVNLVSPKLLFDWQRNGRMDPEQKARLRIDQQLALAGWIVQDYGEMNIAAGLGVAIRESPLLTGEADYLLYVDGQIIGVVEAKPEEHTLTGVETQSAKYSDGLPPELPCWRKPPPFAYESTGAVTQFTNALDPHARSREVFTFHRPEELARLVELEAQLRARLRALPELNPEHLWRVTGYFPTETGRRTESRSFARADRWWVNN